MPSAEEDKNSQNDGAYSLIGKAAEEKARKHGHPAITFNHLLYGLIKTFPDEVDGLLSPDIRVPTLNSLLEKDLAGRPGNTAADAKINISRLAGQALRRAEESTKQRWGGNNLFGAELLNAMVE